jgi:hypothetical protein
MFGTKKSAPLLRAPFHISPVHALYESDNEVKVKFLLFMNLLFVSRRSVFLHTPLPLASHGRTRLRLMTPFSNETFLSLVVY